MGESLLMLWKFQSTQTHLASAQDEISYNNREYYIYVYLNSSCALARCIYVD